MRLKEKLEKMMGPELAVIILLVSLSMTFIAWYVISQNEYKAAKLRFDFYKDSFVAKMNSQMGEYQQALRGAAGLFYASDNVTRSDWKHYIDTLDIINSYPGIQGMGFAEHVSAATKAESIRAVQKEGLDYDIYPAGQRDRYAPIIYVEPFDWRNQRALGYDMWSSQKHRKAMELAASSGQITVTEKLILVQETLEDTQIGFIMYVPIYKNLKHVATSEGNRENFLYGYAYSPFRMKNLMDAITDVSGEFLAIDVYDGNEVDEYALMYRSDHDKPGENQRAVGYFTETVPMKIGEHDWTVLVKSGPEFNNYVRNKESLYALVSGIVISILLFVVAWSLSTSRQRAVKLADKITGDLKVSEERYALAMTGSNDGLWDWNMTNDYIYVAPRFKKLLGYKEKELECTKSSLEKMIHPDDFDKTIEAFVNHIKLRIPLDIETRLQLKNKEYNWFRIKGQAIWGEDGKSQRMAGSLSDINDRKLAAIYLQHQKTELETANKYKSEFLANMSHELRTPLNSIMVLSGLLSDGESSGMTKKQKEQAKIIYRSGNELLELISEILDLSKIEAGKMDIHYEPLEVSAFRKELEMVFEPVAADRGLSLAVELDENIPDEIKTDHKRLYQVIKNLTANSLKFTQEGGIKIRFFRPDNIAGINESLDQTDTLAISVEDTGIGIPKEKYSLIFDAFKQADGTTSRKYGGTGLGLTISREILTLLKGGITVQSEEGKGSIFTVYVPINTNMKDEIIEDESEQTASPHDQAQPAGEDEKHENNISFEPLNAKVLLVDDDIRNIYALTALLERYDCSVLTAENGQDALKVLEKEQGIDLIIMDMMMPVMDGYEATKLIKENPALRDIPLIALTAKAMQEDKDKCLKAGANEYISKPVKCEQLAEVMKSLLNPRKV